MWCFIETWVLGNNAPRQADFGYPNSMLVSFRDMPAARKQQAVIYAPTNSKAQATDISVHCALPSVLLSVYYWDCITS